jgi:glycine cleavage system aminomethyltransferase T
MPRHHSMEQTAAPLKKTPLNARHRASGAKMVPFGGWDMPVEYAGIVQEHMAVRTAPACSTSAIWARSRSPASDALAAVQRISSNDASKLAVGQAQYSGLLTPQGTFVDDLLVYRLAPGAFLCWSSTRRNIAEGLRVDRRADQAGGRRGRRRLQLALRAARAPGTASAGGAAAAHRRRVWPA